MSRGTRTSWITATGLFVALALGACASSGSGGPDGAGTGGRGATGSGGAGIGGVSATGSGGGSGSGGVNATGSGGSGTGGRGATGSGGLGSGGVNATGSGGAATGGVNATGSGGAATGGRGGHGASGTGGRGGTSGAGGAVAFAAVQAIFDARCVSCHDPAHPVGREGPTYVEMPLVAGMAYAALVNQAAHETCGGTRVVPGQPDQSYLYRKVVDATPCSGERMPHKGMLATSTPLPDNDIATIRTWIAGGAKP